VPAERLHLVRHGEVFNPDHILYGRLDGYHLSELGHRMAAAAAESMTGSAVSALYASPLLRAQESAAPWSRLFGLPIVTEDRIIEPTNKFEGTRSDFGPSLLLKPKYWPWITNPLKPSWGEPFKDIAVRVLAAMDDAWTTTDGGHVVMVSHQSPIWIATRSINGKSLAHDPRKRRCHLSSITSFEKQGGTWVEVNYQDPAQELLAASTDLGAV
jgi:broad specificity phosphatase PhoE